MSLLKIIGFHLSYTITRVENYYLRRRIENLEIKNAEARAELIRRGRARWLAELDAKSDETA